MGKHSKQVDCSMCKGTGKVDYCHDSTTEEVDCPGCDGTGKV